jgi:cell division protein FtsB
MLKGAKVKELPDNNPNPQPAVKPGVRLLKFLFESRRRIATCLAIVFAVFLGYHVILGNNGVTVYQQKRNEHKALEQEINQLQEENAKLKEHVDHLKADPGAIEHEARERLHYARPGEVIYTLNETPAEPQPAPAAKPQK